MWSQIDLQIWGPQINITKWVLKLKSQNKFVGFRCQKQCPKSTSQIGISKVRFKIHFLIIQGFQIQVLIWLAKWGPKIDMPNPMYIIEVLKSRSQEFVKPKSTFQFGLWNCCQIQSPKLIQSNFFVESHILVDFDCYFDIWLNKLDYNTFSCLSFTFVQN
jgi:hypothetical protein